MQSSLEKRLVLSCYDQVQSITRGRESLFVAALTRYACVQGERPSLKEATSSKIGDVWSACPLADGSFLVGTHKGLRRLSSRGVFGEEVLPATLGDVLTPYGQTARGDIVFSSGNDWFLLEAGSRKLKELFKNSTATLTPGVFDGGRTAIIGDYVGAVTSQGVGQIRAIDIVTGETLWSERTASVKCIALNGETIVVSTLTGVNVRSITTGKKLGTYSKSYLMSSFLAVSPDGSRCILDTPDGLVCLSLPSLQVLGLPIVADIKECAWYDQNRLLVVEGGTNDGEVYVVEIPVEWQGP